MNQLNYKLVNWGLHEAQNFIGSILHDAQNFALECLRWSSAIAAIYSQQKLFALQTYNAPLIAMRGTMLSTGS